MIGNCNVRLTIRKRIVLWKEMFKVQYNTLFKKKYQGEVPDISRLFFNELPNYIGRINTSLQFLKDFSSMKEPDHE
jgi:hypothetical protein